jgi:hypothetical protein
LNEASFPGYKACTGSKPAKDFAVGQTFFAHSWEISIAGLRTRRMLAHRTGGAWCFQEWRSVEFENDERAECMIRENCGARARIGRLWGRP